MSVLASSASAAPGVKATFWRLQGYKPVCAGGERVGRPLVVSDRSLYPPRPMSILNWGEVHLLGIFQHITLKPCGCAGMQKSSLAVYSLQY